MDQSTAVPAFFAAFLRVSASAFSPDVFGEGGHAPGVRGGGFLGWVSFLVLGLFHIVIVAGRDGTAGVLRWRLDGI